MNLGVALSGGGVRSAAQLGIMQALKEKGVQPTIYTGTSGGAVVATLLALGNTPEEALSKYRLTNNVLDIAYWEFIKSVFTRSSFNGIYKGNKLEAILEKVYDGKCFKNTVGGNRFAVVTTNVNDGKQVIFSNYATPDQRKISDHNFIFASSQGVKLSLAVSASTRLPAVFMPKPFLSISFSPDEDWCKYEKMSLIDGGIVNNLPADVAASLGADKVISIDLGYTGKAREIQGLYPVIKQSIDIMQERVVDKNMKDIGIYLNPEIYDVKVLDFGRIDECFERGYKYGVANAENIILGL